MWWTVAKEAVAIWSRLKDARQGAALAYYSVFSLGPIILIAIAEAGLFFGQDAVTTQVMSSKRDAGRHRREGGCWQAQAVPSQVLLQPSLG